MAAVAAAVIEFFMAAGMILREERPPTDGGCGGCL
jgi:hypothetical protein